MLNVTSDVSSGSYVNYTWNGLVENAKYYWRVLVSDGKDVTHGPVWDFTTVNNAPEITNVTDSPDTVGFGFNVTINADVSDNGSGLDEVNVSIDYPGPVSSNFTMSHIGDDTYEYVFDDTWLVGQYNYTIWAYDNYSNSNSY